MKFPIYEAQTNLRTEKQNDLLASQKTRTPTEPSC